jgi:uncharacterized repeat protein (TIGR03803 family)
LNRIQNVFFSFSSSRSLACSISLLVLVASALAGSNEQVIYRFKGGTDGYAPTSNLLMDSAGNLYGTTVEGGTLGTCVASQHGCGTVFELKRPAHAGDPWVETVLYRFMGGSDGIAPTSALVADKNGNLYGTTVEGGSCSNGTIFELDRPSSSGAAWTHRVLYNFKGVPDGRGAGDGAQPDGVVFDAAGNLYGATDGGGFCTNFEGLVNCSGSVFELAAPSNPGGGWTESVLHRFGPSGVSNPHDSLIFDNNGNIFATAYVGGVGFGGVFELTRPSAPGNPWAEKTLYEFNNTDGGAPNGSLVFDGAGNLYGTTLQGGAANMGTVFELTPPASPGGSWTETELYGFQSFQSGDGNAPLANVTFDKLGNLFSTAVVGGDLNRGTVFQLTPPSNGGEWTETTLHTFGSGDDGQQPGAGLIWGHDGALYGTAEMGGSSPSEQCILDGYAWSCGVVFRIEP